MRWLVSLSKLCTVQLRPHPYWESMDIYNKIICQPFHHKSSKNPVNNSVPVTVSSDKTWLEWQFFFLNKKNGIKNNRKECLWVERSRWKQNPTTMSVKLEFIIEIRMYVVTLQLRLLPTSLSFLRDVWTAEATNENHGFLATVQSEVRKQSTRFYLFLADVASIETEIRGNNQISFIFLSLNIIPLASTCQLWR